MVSVRPEPNHRVHGQRTILQLRSTVPDRAIFGVAFRVGGFGSEFRFVAGVGASGDEIFVGDAVCVSLFEWNAAFGVGYDEHDDECEGESEWVGGGGTDGGGEFGVGLSLEGI